MTSLTAIIPTVARDRERLTLLRRSLESALHQCREGDEVLVAGDTRLGELDEVRDLCRHFAAEVPPGVGVRYAPHDGGRMSWGHDQLNHAMTVARGEYLTFCDDDDVYCAGAFDAMREAIEALTAPAPLLFRFRAHFGATFWDTPGQVACGHIGGHCIVTPALPSFLGKWSERYEGDFDFIADTLARWAAVGVEPLWIDRLISIARPG